MIPPEFEYTAPASLEDALTALADGGEDAKVLAGGHSLLPLMKLRLAAPTLLVDIRKVPGLRGVQRENGMWRVGAMTRHADVARSNVVQAAIPALALAGMASGVALGVKTSLTAKPTRATLSSA